MKARRTNHSDQPRVRYVQQSIIENDKIITVLEAEYQEDASSRRAYQKSTHEKLSKAYDRQAALQIKFEAKQTEYNIVDAEKESSGEESSKKSSNSVRTGSSVSSTPAVLCWACGCGQLSYAVAATSIAKLVITARLSGTLNPAGLTRTRGRDT